MSDEVREAAERLKELTEENSGLRSDLDRECRAVKSLTEQWSKDIAAKNEARQKIAAAIDYCRKHTHPGVNVASHEHLAKVIEILEERTTQGG